MPSLSKHLSFHTFCEWGISLGSSVNFKVGCILFQTSKWGIHVNSLNSNFQLHWNLSFSFFFETWKLAKNKAKCQNAFVVLISSGNLRCRQRIGGTLLQFRECRELLMDLVFCDFWLMLPEQIFISKFGSCCMHKSRLSVNQTFSRQSRKIKWPIIQIKNSGISMFRVIKLKNWILGQKWRYGLSVWDMCGNWNWNA